MSWSFKHLQNKRKYKKSYRLFCKDDTTYRGKVEVQQVTLSLFMGSKQLRRVLGLPDRQNPHKNVHS